MIGRLLLLLTALLLTRPTLAQPPALPHDHFTLPSGMDVILHPDRSVPLVAVSVWYHVGSGVERPGKSGFAHLFEHMMFQGSVHTGQDVHFDLLRKAGASNVNGSTNSDRTNYYEVVPPHALELALWLESDRMGWMLPLLTQASLDNQREVVRNERRQRYDNVPYGPDRFAVAAGLYPPGHPYRFLTIGRHEDLEAASVDDVVQFFRRWYVPSNATLTLSGDFDPAQAKALVHKWFGDFPKADKPVPQAIPVPTIKAPVVVTVRDRLARLRRLHLAWHSPAFYAPGDAELDLLANALGATGTGRLWTQLVHERQLAQSVSVYQQSQMGVSQFHVVVDLKPGADAATVAKVTQDVLAQVRREPLTEAELRRAVTDFEVGFVWGLESVLARGEQLQAYRHYLGDATFIDKDLARYTQATATGVRDQAQKWLDPLRRVEVWTELRDGILAGAGQAQDPTDVALPADPTPPALAFADAPFRAKAHVLGKPASVKSPLPVVRKLANGLQMFVVERPLLPVVAFELVWDGGLATDPSDATGLSSVCMELLGDGTEALDKLALHARLADLGAVLRPSSNRDELSIDGSVLVQHLDPTLDLLADLVLRPGWRADELQRIVARRKAALQQAAGNPSSVAQRLQAKVAYGNAHPWGRLEADASLDRITVDACRAYWTTRGKPNGARLFAVGRITAQELESRLTARFAGWQGSPPPMPVLPPPQPLGGGRVFLAHVPGAQQTVVKVLHLGPPRTAKDWAATTLGATILGGGFSSRLNMNLREKQGWAYGASGGFSYDRTGGGFLASASVRSDATGGALREIVREMEGMRDAPATADELQREKQGLVLGLADRLSTNRSLLSSLMGLHYHGLAWQEHESWPARFGKVTAKHVQAAMVAHLQPQEAKVLVVGDAEKVGPLVEQALKEGALGPSPGAVRRMGVDGVVVGL
jgi:zinc protease